MPYSEMPEMNSLGDFFNSDDKAKLLSSVWSPGDVYGLLLNEDNGITPHEGEDARYKYFIVLGIDAEGNIYGGVVINSKINPNQNPRLKLFHYPLSHLKYSFLKKNSFVNCVSLQTVMATTLAQGNLLGHIDDEDLALIKQTVVCSGVIPVVRLKQFGLIIKE